MMRTLLPLTALALVLLASRSEARTPAALVPAAREIRQLASAVDPGRRVTRPVERALGNIMRLGRQGGEVKSTAGLKGVSVEGSGGGRHGGEVLRISTREGKGTLGRVFGVRRIAVQRAEINDGGSREVRRTESVHATSVRILPGVRLSWVKSSTREQRGKLFYIDKAKTTTRSLGIKVGGFGGWLPKLTLKSKQPYEPAVTARR